MSETPQLKILKQIRDSIPIGEYVHRGAWDSQMDVTREPDEPPEAGWWFDVREDGGYRKIRIVVTNLGFMSDPELQ